MDQAFLVPVQDAPTNINAYSERLEGKTRKWRVR